MASMQRKPSSGTASKIASCLSFWTSSGKWSPIRLILVTYRPETSWVISSRAKQNMETLYEGPQTTMVVFAIRTVDAEKPSAILAGFEGVKVKQSNSRWFKLIGFQFSTRLKSRFYDCILALCQKDKVFQQSVISNV